MKILGFTMIGIGMFIFFVCAHQIPLGWEEDELLPERPLPIHLIVASGGAKEDNLKDIAGMFSGVAVWLSGLFVVCFSEYIKKKHPMTKQ